MTTPPNGAPARLGTSWTEEDIATLKLMRAAGMSVAAMAAKLERSHRGVMMMLGRIDAAARPVTIVKGISFLELFGNSVPGIKPEGP